MATSLVYSLSPTLMKQEKCGTTGRCTCILFVQAFDNSQSICRFKLTLIVTVTANSLLTELTVLNLNGKVL